MGALDQEIERQLRRRGSEIFEPVVVRSQADIKRVLYNFDPSRNVDSTIRISTDMMADDGSGQRHRYRVNADTVSYSQRGILLEGFNILRSRREMQAKSDTEVQPILVNGRPMRSPLRDIMDAQMWVDPLITRWLGAVRRGLDICWDIDEWRYNYDIYLHKLIRVKIGAE